MSLWTPDGERPIRHDDEAENGGAPGEPDEELSEEERTRLEEMAEQMAEVRQQLLSVPASTVVANHAMGLYELAAIHLSADPANLDDARVAIDAMAAVVEGLEGRLGENEAVLRDAVAQLRLAFVQVRAGAGGGEAEGADG
ncbi:MAG: hypothetical protein ACRD0G_16005 [Acidimicrobiales bacterium]